MTDEKANLGMDYDSVEKRHDLRRTWLEVDQINPLLLMGNQIQIYFVREKKGVRVFAGIYSMVDADDHYIKITPSIITKRKETALINMIKKSGEHLIIITDENGKTLDFFRHIKPYAYYPIWENDFMEFTIKRMKENETI